MSGGTMRTMTACLMLMLMGCAGTTGKLSFTVGSDSWFCQSVRVSNVTV